MCRMLKKRAVMAQTPSQQSNILDNGQEDVSPSGQWNPYPLGRRDVPPDTITKKVTNFKLMTPTMKLAHPL